MQNDSLFRRNSGLRVPHNPKDREPGTFLSYRAKVALQQGEQAVLRFYANSPSSIFLNGEFWHFGPCRSSVPILYYDEIPLSAAGQLEIRQCVEKGFQAGILLEIEYSDGSFGLQSPRDISIRRMTEYAVTECNAGTGFKEAVSLRKPKIAYESAVEQSEKIAAQHLRRRPIPLFRQQERLPIACTAESPDVFTFDFGTMVLGFCEVAGNASETVVLEYIESFSGGWSSPMGTVVMYSDEIRNINGVFLWRSLHKRSFRYLRIRGLVEKPQLRVQEYKYPLKQSGNFRCSDAVFNHLADISVDTLAVCMDDIYNDCPHRDQAQWMDAFATAQIALGIGGISDLTRKCLEQYALCSVRDGKVISPSISGVSSFADYALILFRFVQWYFRCTKDRTLVEEVYDSLAAVIREFRQYETPEHLLDYPQPPGTIVYLDNTFELPKKGVSTALNALYAGALTALAELATISGRQKDAEIFSTGAEQVRKAIGSLCVHPLNSACFRDNFRFYGQKFFLVNFSCELGHWSGRDGVLEFSVHKEQEARSLLVYAVYSGIRFFLNGEIIVDQNREATWKDQPIYEPEQVKFILRSGKNHFRFEVCSNLLNWELFFCFPGGENPENATVSEFDPETGRLLSSPKPLRLRKWRPPEFAQSTQAFAAFSEVFPAQTVPEKMLRETFRERYPRTYLSVRVPYFCTECRPGEDDEPWVMPTNTPWSTFFLLGGLFENNCGAEGLQVIRRYWTPMVKAGAVNTWEEWGSRSSLCHAWGAVPLLFFQRNILGVHHDTWYRGYILIRPQLFDLKFAEGDVALLMGRRIRIRLELNVKSVILTILAPTDVLVKLETDLLPDCVLSVESRFSAIKRKTATE